MKQFFIGEKVVYPAYGVSEITAIERKKVAGEEIDFYILKILDNDMRLMIPKENAIHAGMRNIISAEEADNVLRLLAMRIKKDDFFTWNRRYREYLERIKTGSIYDLVKVLKNLYQIKSNKDLSFGEKKMFDTAKSLLINELSEAKKVSHKEIENKLYLIFE